MRTLKSSAHGDSVSTPDLRRAFRLYPFSTLLSTGFGVGLFAWAPGTAASLVAAVLAWRLSDALTPPDAPSLAGSLGLLMSGLLLGLAGVPLSSRASRGLGGKDPGCIVLDEIAGQLVACAPAPFFLYSSPFFEATVWLTSFLTFRLLDIWKPGPIRRLQELPEGLGIVADDLVCGAVASAITCAVAWALSR